MKLLSLRPLSSRQALRSPIMRRGAPRWVALCGAAVVAAFGACGGDDEATVLPGPPAPGGGSGGSAGGGAMGGTGAGGDLCPSGVVCGPYAECCDFGQECVNDMACLPVCDHERCGENLVDCCAADQFCLAGLKCASDCPNDEALCGADLDTCCSVGDVCVYDQCVTPGLPCNDNFDCLDDQLYCEQTLGLCLPIPPGELCQGDPTFQDIQPELEWYWPSIDYNGLTYQNIIAPPVVGDVNGDGTPDVVVVTYRSSTDTLMVVLDGAGDGQGNGNVLFTIPSAADPTAPQPYWLGGASLANFDADPGLEIVYFTENNSVRIADHDGEGTLGERAGFGTLSTLGSATVSDLDHDGSPDVVVQCVAMDGSNDGANISSGANDFVNEGPCGHQSVVADLNEDGKPEIIDASHAFTVDPNVPGGVPFWTGNNGITSGYPAVADILPDVPGPEVVNIYYEFFLIDGATGDVLVGPGGSVIDAAIPIPGSGRGGAPTVADFDGDGLPEISTAGLTHYVVYDPDCWSPPARTGGQCASGSTDFQLWTTPTQDASSHRTGSSVFDFQGDGPAEVLYNDECFFHIYDGTTGVDLVDPEVPSSSQTAQEYPLVADVDGDGNAEMVVISSAATATERDDCESRWKEEQIDIDWLCQITDCTGSQPCQSGSCDYLDTPHPVSGNANNWDSYQCDSQNVCRMAGGTHGVRIYGDAFDQWVGTRPVWNQFNYHVTDFEFQGGTWDVPITEQANWQIHNNYRQNVQGGVLFPVPDLQIELVATPICGTEVKLSATITNVGSAGAPMGVPVQFYRIDAGATDPPEWIGELSTTTTILPGGWEIMFLSYPHTPKGIDLVFAASVDPLETVEECDDDNNDATSAPVSCPAGPT